MLFVCFFVRRHCKSRSCSKSIELFLLLLIKKYEVFLNKRSFAHQPTQTIFQWSYFLGFNLQKNKSINTPFFIAFFKLWIVIYFFNCPNTTTAICRFRIRYQMAFHFLHSELSFKLFNFEIEYCMQGVQFWATISRVLRKYVSIDIKQFLSTFDSFSGQWNCGQKLFWIKLVSFESQKRSFTVSFCTIIY